MRQKPETARQHNAPQVGESELRPKSDKLIFFEGMMKEFGCTLVDCTPKKKTNAGRSGKKDAPPG